MLNLFSWVCRWGFRASFHEAPDTRFLCHPTDPLIHKLPPSLTKHAPFTPLPIWTSKAPGDGFGQGATRSHLRGQMGNLCWKIHSPCCMYWSSAPINHHPTQQIKCLPAAGAIIISTWFLNSSTPAGSVLLPLAIGVTMTTNSWAGCS